MRRLRPDDDYMIRIGTDKTPQHIGALQYYDLGGRPAREFLPAVREHFRKRLPATPLLCRHRHAPLKYDGDVWLGLAACDLDYHIQGVPVDHPLTGAEVHEFIERKAVQALDFSKPPFKTYVLDRLVDGAVALYVKIHHSVADGVGFQNIMAILTDPSPEPTYDDGTRLRNERAPLAPLWLVRSALRFRGEARERQVLEPQLQALRAAFREFRKDPANERAPTPQLAFARNTSDQRRYTSLSLPLDQVKTVGKRLDASVNDVFLAVAAGAMRRYLLEVGDLPDQPLVALAARSYRKPEHGPFGNRIITLNPTINTEIGDPVVRLRAIQASMGIELRRSRLVEQLISEHDMPFGARKRYAEYQRRTAGGQAVMQGNISLSNVPGPGQTVYLAGFEMLTNYPTPILGSGRSLNITLRRYRDHLDLGIMTDPGQIEEVEQLRTYLIDALDELAAASTAPGRAGESTAQRT